MNKMKYKYKVVATVGEYTGKDGQKKKRYVQVGACFESDEGRLSVKLETIPIGPGWSGWLSFYEPDNTAGTSQSPPSYPSGEEDGTPF